MKKAIFLILVLGLAAGLGYSLNVYAQEAQPAPAPVPAPEAAPAVEGQEAYGEVVSIDVKACTIAITEYDYEKDQDTNKTYTIDKAATYDNVKSLDEVKVGDWVALTLKPEKEGANIAASVYVERYDIGEEAMPAAPVVTPAPAPEAAPAPAPVEHPGATVPEETK